MKYFIDFDRTVFDTDAFKKSIAGGPTLRELVTQFRDAVIEFFQHDPTTRRRQRFTRTWGTFLSHGRFAFKPEELTHFLYPDVEPFLSTHDCTIVTYGVRAFITAKVATTLRHLPVTDIVYTSRKKGPTIKRLTEAANDSCTFIDDMHFQLASVSRWCPDVQVIEMRRDGKEGTGSWPVIRSLAEVTD